MDERTRALWVMIRRALLMMVSAIEVFLGVEGEKRKGKDES
jgi:hypothetical protein